MPRQTPPDFLEEVKKHTVHSPPYIPHWEKVDYADFLVNLALGGHHLAVHSGYVRLHGVDGPSGYVSWTTFFLHRTQNSIYDGSGMFVRYEASRPPITGRFWICKHEKVDAPDANHIRGWHPGWCKLCGLDMTVDSGD